MIRLISFFAVFSAVVGCAAEKANVQLRFAIPERNVTGSQPQPWPKGIREQMMDRLARDATGIADGIFKADVASSLVFHVSLSSDAKNAFDVVVSMPESSRTEVEKKMKEMLIQFTLRYVEMAFTYDTTGALSEKPKQSP